MVLWPKLRIVASCYYVPQVLPFGWCGNIHALCVPCERSWCSDSGKHISLWCFWPVWQWMRLLSLLNQVLYNSTYASLDKWARRTLVIMFLWLNRWYRVDIWSKQCTMQPTCLSKTFQTTSFIHLRIIYFDLTYYLLPLIIIIEMVSLIFTSILWYLYFRCR